MIDKVAVISDIHGNMPALEVVLDDIRARGIEQIICLGDLAGKGPHSTEAVDTIRACCDQVMLGNWDALLAETVSHPTLVWWHEQLGAERRAYLGSLPFCYDLQISSHQLRFFHASQQSVYYRVFPRHEEAVLAAMFTNSEATGYDQPEPDVVLYGDIHSAYLLPVGRFNKLINVGSVGNPLDQTLATYVVLSGKVGASQRTNLDVEFVRLPYDVEKTIRQAKAVGMPETEALAKELRTGVYRGA